MALTLQTVSPAQGVQWVRKGAQLFMLKPLAFSVMLALFLAAALLLSAFGVPGGLLALASLPLLSLGFMVASESALRGGPVAPVQFIDPLRGAVPRRKSLLVLCAAYAAATLALLLLSDAVDGGSFEELQRAVAQGPAGKDATAAALADPRLLSGLLLRLGGTALLSIPFWHAPALVHWAGQGAAHALFSSTVAVWRAKGAFTLYALAWVAALAVFGLVAGAVFTLFGAPQLVGLVVLPVALTFSTAFYVSLWFTFDDSFHYTRGA